MATVDPTMSVGEIARAHHGAAVVFEQIGIDYCCGGKRSLADAAAKRGLDGETVAAMLGALLAATPSTAGHDVNGASIGELCEHIERRHHDGVRADFERIGAMTAKVARRHGPSDPRLVEADRVFTAIRDELLPHLDREEREVFPACRAIERGEAADLAAIAELEDDHAELGQALATLRELCGGYDIDAAYCMTHRTMLGSLAAFEQDMHQHVHEENNILFPRVREAAAAR